MVCCRGGLYQVRNLDGELRFRNNAYDENVITYKKGCCISESTCDFVESSDPKYQLQHEFRRCTTHEWLDEQLTFDKITGHWFCFIHDRERQEGRYYTEIKYCTQCKKVIPKKVSDKKQHDITQAGWKQALCSDCIKKSTYKTCYLCGGKGMCSGKYIPTDNGLMLKQFCSSCMEVWKYGFEKRRKRQFDNMTQTRRKIQVAMEYINLGYKQQEKEEGKCPKRKKVSTEPAEG